MCWYILQMLSQWYTISLAVLMVRADDIRENEIQKAVSHDKDERRMKNKIPNFISEMRNMNYLSHRPKNGANGPADEPLKHPSSESMKSTFVAETPLSEVDTTTIQTLSTIKSYIAKVA